jgi:D-lactate dehydrogenase
VWKTAAKHWGALSQTGGIALTVAGAVPAVLPIAATRVARAIAGADTVPLYDERLPGGGRPRQSVSAGEPVAVFFSACIGTMFGPAQGSHGVTRAFLDLCTRAGVSVATPDGIAGLCCGTPWKSKGYLDGYAQMTETVLPSLMLASRNGALPIVCDAASCTEGLTTMARLAAASSPEFAALRFVDAVQFVHETVVQRLTVSARVDSIAIHHTCSSTELGTNAAMTALARFVSDVVVVPIDTGCCAFAGDRGLLHPELTASATLAEAAELDETVSTEYVSANRTCELGMTRATGHEYRHLLEVVEQATR